MPHVNEQIMADRIRDLEEERTELRLCLRTE